MEEEDREHALRAIGPFGVLGWDVMLPSAAITGEITGLRFYTFKAVGIDEKDWNIFFKPDDPKWATYNGRPNREPGRGLMELEVQPREPYDTRQALGYYMSKFRGDLVAGKVTACGAWVNDKGHGNKTELHPVTLFVKAGLLDPITIRPRDFKILAMAEDSGSRGAWVFVPFARRNWRARIVVSLVPSVGALRIVEEKSEAQRADFSEYRIDSVIGGQRDVVVEIETGQYGFFYGEYAIAKEETCSCGVTCGLNCPCACPYKRPSVLDQAPANGITCEPA
jgi:hypothetical protein